MVVGARPALDKSSSAANGADSRTHTRWLVRAPADEDTSRLFCFPHAGAGASVFSSWPIHLGGIGIYPLQFPGRENRLGEQSAATYGQLAAGIAQALVPHLDRPFAFFGHCVGAWSAYETAIQLGEAGMPRPRRLFASGQAAPHISDSDPMLKMSELELRENLTIVLKSRGVEPRPDMIELGFTVLWRDIEAVRTYQRTAPVELNCPISVLRWRDDADVDHEAFKEWNRYSNIVDMHELEGGKYEFIDLSEKLQTLLHTW